MNDADWARLERKELGIGKLTEWLQQLQLKPLDLLRTLALYPRALLSLTML